MKRNPILLNKTEKEQLKERIVEQASTIKRNQIIAIVGAYEGAGCTHHALNLAYTLSKQYKTALVELDKASELEGFNEEYKLEEGVLSSKKLEDLDVYFNSPKKDINDLAIIFKQKYDYIVLDIGRLYEEREAGIERVEGYNEVYRADTRILITQLKEWKNKYFERFINNEDIEDWIIGINLTAYDDYKRIKKDIEKVNKQTKVVNLEYSEVFKHESILKDNL